MWNCGMLASCGMFLCWFSNYWYHAFRFGIFYLCEFYVNMYITRSTRWSSEENSCYNSPWRGFFFSWAQGDLNSSETVSPLSIIFICHQVSHSFVNEASTDMSAWWIFNKWDTAADLCVYILQRKMTLLTTCRFSFPLWLLRYGQSVYFETVCQTFWKTNVSGYCRLFVYNFVVQK